MSRSQYQSSPVGQGGNSLGFLHSFCKWFFNQHMPTCSQNLFYLLGMEYIGRAQYHCVHRVESEGCI